MRRTGKVGEIGEGVARHGRAVRPRARKAAGGAPYAVAGGLTMFRHHDGQWDWEETVLPLSPMESALLTELIRYAGQRRPPHRWLAAGLGRPVSPATGRVVLRLLQQTLDWFDLPPDLIRADLVLGVAMDPAVAVADDLGTLAALTGDQADITTA